MSETLETLLAAVGLTVADEKQIGAREVKSRVLPNDGGTLTWLMHALDDELHIVMLERRGETPRHIYYGLDGYAAGEAFQDPFVRV